MGHGPAARRRHAARRAGPVGQQLVPADRRGGLQLAVGLAGVLPALPAPDRRAGRVLADHYVVAGVTVSLAAGAGLRAPAPAFAPTARGRRRLPHRPLHRGGADVTVPRGRVQRVALSRAGGGVLPRGRAGQARVGGRAPSGSPQRSKRKRLL